MIETIIGIAIAFIIWNLRKAFYSQSEVYKEKIDIMSADSKADLQEDYEELSSKIIDIKAKHGGKWHSMNAIEALMKADGTDLANQTNTNKHSNSK